MLICLLDTCLRRAVINAVRRPSLYYKKETLKSIMIKRLDFFKGYKYAMILKNILVNNLKV